MVAVLHADDKKKLPTFYLKPGQVTDLQSFKLVTARDNCENWAVAAGLEAMLQKEGVALNQNFWVMRISGNEICAPDLPSIEAVSKAVNGEFVLGDGPHVRLELRYTPNAPANTDALIAGLKQQQLSLLLLRGHAYYLTGATYDEYINRDGSRLFMVTELRLADTFAKQPAVTFQKGRDNMEDIGGTLSVSVSPAT